MNSRGEMWQQMGVHGIETSCESRTTGIWQGEKIQDNTMQVRDMKYIHMYVCNDNGLERTGCNGGGGFAG
jgi:hypothetical protein